MDWVRRAIDQGITITPRILTEQYINSMKALGYDSIHIATENEDLPKNNSKVYCHRDECIVDSNETGFYVVHVSGCSLTDNSSERV